MPDFLRPTLWLIPFVVVTLGLVVLSGALAWSASPMLVERGQWRMYVDVYDEMNLTTWWSTVVLALGAVSYAVVAALSGPGWQRRRWAVLAAVVALLSLDEATVLHERLDRFVLDWLSPEDFPYLWVVPGLAIGAAVVICVVVLTWTAPRAARRWLVLGFLLLLGSALGGELVQGWLVSEGRLGLPFVLCYHLEEAGEMLGGVALLGGGLRMLVLRRAAPGVRLELVGAGTADRADGVTTDAAALR